MRQYGLAGRLMRSTILTGLATATAMPAFAQDDEESDDEIIVSGTRLQRDDLAAPSPVTTVSSEQLVLTNTVNNEQFLNTLPQVIPAFDQTSNNPGNGTASVSLRGLGTQRTLVLVDGKRFVASGVGSTVDLNNIPTALVERIEVITGGASAVYGSDATAGVVNFVLKDDFEGIQLDASHQLSAAGWDANQTNVALTVGGDFADGRGNAVFSASYTNREALLQGERPLSQPTLFDPGPGGEEFILGGSTNVEGTRFRGATSSNFGLSTAEVEGIDPNCVNNFCSGLFVDEAGQTRGLRFGPFGPGTDLTTDLYNYGPANFLQLPQERYNIAGFGTYEINDHVEAYARGVFSNTVVDSQLAPTPTGTLTLDINLDNPFLAQRPELLAAITNDANSNNGDGTATVRINRRMTEIGTRNSLRDTTAFQIVTGLRGDLNENWSYDTFFNFTRSTVSQIQTGNISVAAFQDALLCDGGPTAIASGCTDPALNIFGGPGSVSAEAAEFVSRTGAQIDTIESIQWVGTVTGNLEGFKSPWAESGAGVVLGLEYRENAAESTPDSVLGPDVRGFNQSLPVGGRFDVYEVFGELGIPLVQGQPFFENLALQAQYRYSDYSTVGGQHSFAGGLEWDVGYGLRLRGQFQRSVRAPNIGELFAPSTNGFPGAQDPCSGGTFGGFDAGVSQALCIASGVPAAQVGAGFQSNGQIEALFGGNTDLFEEESDTFTVGAVWQPEFVDGLSIQIDYFNITVDDAIATPPLQTLFNECFRESIAASCSFFNGVRNPATGELANPFIPSLINVNIAQLAVEGIDINIGYGFDADQIGLPSDAGSFSLQYYGSYALENSFQTTPNADVIDCVGLFAGNCGEPTPEYSHTAQLGWNLGDLTTSIRYRFLTSLDADLGGGTPSDLSDDISAFHYFDVTMQYAATENLDLTLGVQNITGRDAPQLGSTFSEQGNTFPATFTTLGRQLFFGASVRF